MPGRTGLDALAMLNVEGDGGHSALHDPELRHCFDVRAVRAG
jgi:hypothetical protein